MIEGGASGGAAARLRYGMVGGGQGACIGDVHRKPIALDGLVVIAAGRRCGRISAVRKTIQKELTCRG